MTGVGGWIATRVTRYSGLVVVAMLLMTVLIGAGMGSLETATTLDQFETDSPEANDLAYVAEAFEGESENETTVQIVVRGDDVLTRESFLATLRLQRAIRSDPRIEPTLTEDPFEDLASIVATAAMQEPGAPPRRASHRSRPRSINSSRWTMPPSRPFSLSCLAPMAGGSCTGSCPRTTSQGRLLRRPARVIVSQKTEEPVAGGEAPERITEAQTAMQSIVEERLGDRGLVFGAGLISDEIDRSLSDSLQIVLPLAILFVLGVLAIAYRDVLDIVLGLAGILLVLVWTFGAMGWLGLGFSQIMVAVPVLLVGLSIDYAIHVFMRTREARQERKQRSIREAIDVVLRGLGVALVLVTAAAVIGFLANLVSPIGPIQEFGLASALGITAALLIFGLLVPAAKIELDAALEARGIDRRKRAFGTGGGGLERLLAGGASLAGRVPWLVVGIAVLLAIAGAAGATQLDTSFEQEDFIADEPPDWMDTLQGQSPPGSTPQSRISSTSRIASSGRIHRHRSFSGVTSRDRTHSRHSRPSRQRPRRRMPWWSWPTTRQVSRVRSPSRDRSPPRTKRLQPPSRPPIQTEMAFPTGTLPRCSTPSLRPRPARPPGSSIGPGASTPRCGC
ncbi:MAG: MMPL family transporter [Natrialbaceae archaeon]|nr:MMPL family transporter [Natrialbaceae archaeon]